MRHFDRSGPRRHAENGKARRMQKRNTAGKPAAKDAPTHRVSHLRHSMRCARIILE
ncbi:hypothetical protein OH687_22555 [Burkholderia anthina]|nr:hypothetical protein OH687_22555 [Burkholderia anthina]